RPLEQAAPDMLPPPPPQLPGRPRPMCRSRTPRTRGVQGRHEQDPRRSSSFSIT
ncbi:hypothetical protein COCCADRAFT_104413, partial [Bipolaris zeicola 26-R-13]